MSPDLDQDQLQVGIYLSLCDLLGCATAAQLKAVWLELPEHERRILRRSRPLAHHAWSLIRDRILTEARGTR